MIRASGPVFCEDSVKKDFITWIAVTRPGASGPIFCEDSVKTDSITWMALTSQCASGPVLCEDSVKKDSGDVQNDQTPRNPWL